MSPDLWGSGHDMNEVSGVTAAEGRRFSTGADTKRQKRNERLKLKRAEKISDQNTGGDMKLAMKGSAYQLGNYSQHNDHANKSTDRIRKKLTS